MVSLLKIRKMFRLRFSTILSLGIFFLNFVLISGDLNAAMLRLDERFKPNFTHTQGGFEYVNDIKEQSDGKIVVGGWYDFVDGVARGRISRINPDGTVDSSFNPGTGVDNEVKAIAVLPDNKVVVAGYFWTVNGISKKNIARLNADGSVDTSFDVNADHPVFCITNDHQERNYHLFIGGQFKTIKGVERNNIAKLTANGALDTSFNPGLGVTSSYRHWVWAIAALPDGKVLAGGDFTSFNSIPAAGLVRLTASGTVDSAFKIGTGFNGPVRALAVQPDGKYLVAGAFTSFNGSDHKGIVRLLNTGAIDPSFNCHVTGGFGEIRSMGLQADGHILIGGNFEWVNGVSRRNIARINPDGSLDQEFDPGTGVSDTVQNLAVLRQDQVVIGGFFTTVDDQKRGKIARFNSDPALGGPNVNPHTVFAGGKDDWRFVRLPRAFVNTATLDLVTEGTLYYMDTLGPPLFIRLTYDSFPYTESTGSFGNRWRFLYESSLTLRGSSQVVLQKGTGERETFSSSVDLSIAKPTSPVLLNPMKGRFNRLSCYGTYWLYTEKDTRLVYRFEASTFGQPAYLTKISDRNGNEMSISVDLKTGRIGTIKDSAGRQVHFSYDNYGRCSTITVPDLRKIGFLYDIKGNLTQITDMMGNIGRYTYDDAGYLTSTNLGGRYTSFLYDNKNWGDGKYVSSITDSRGTTKITPINGSVNEVLWITPDGRSSKLYSEKSKTAAIQDPLGAVRKFTYVEGLPISYTDANGKIIYSEYDDRGNTIITRDALSHTFRYEYDENNNMTHFIDARGYNWYYTYDAKGNLLNIRYPDGTTIAFVYDAKGRVISYENQLHRITKYTYDDYGNLRKTLFPDNGVLTYYFDGSDQYTRCQKIIDTRGNEKYYRYDANNRIKTVTYGVTGNEIVYTYDALSLISVKDELGNITKAERNDFGLITKLTDPLNAFSTFTYDGNNNLIEQRDPLSRTMKTTINPANLPIESTDPMNNVLKREYDAERNLISITDQRNYKTYFAYDENNRLKTIRDPMNQIMRYNYDANGRISSIVNARGMRIDYSYDGVGNLLSKSFNDNLQVSYTYDEAGNMTSANHVETGNISYSYDENGRMKTLNWPDGKMVRYAYDTEGNLISLTYPDGLVVSYQYDAFCRRKLASAFILSPKDDISPYPEKANQVIKMKWAGYIIDFQYDKAASLTGESRSNGTSSIYTYNANRKITSIDHRKGTSSFLKFNYAYDPAGNVISSDRTDTLSPHLIIASKNSTYNEGNGILSVSGTGCTSDADGNITAIGTIFTAAYDAENKPLSSKLNGLSITYAYDGNNHPYRIIKGGITYVYHWDKQGKLLFITDSAGALLNRFVYRGFNIVAEQVQNGAWYFYHHDNIGNTVALSDALGNVISKYAYTPSGLKIQNGTTNLVNPFTFIGKYGTLELAEGLYLMGSRLYDAENGRFMQRDPKGHTNGLNLFVYAGNNPIGYIDPAGTEEVDPQELDNIPEEQQPQIAFGTADLNSGKLPYDPDKEYDKKLFEIFGKEVDNALETGASIPGMPIPGGNFTTAARALRDKQYLKAGWEAAKGIVGLIPVHGEGALLGIEITEAIVTNMPKNPTPLYIPRQQYVR